LEIALLRAHLVATLASAERNMGPNIALRFFGRRHNSVACHAIRNNNLNHALKIVASVQSIAIGIGPTTRRLLAMPNAYTSTAERNMGKNIALRFLWRRQNSVARHAFRKNKLKNALHNVKIVRPLVMAAGAWVLNVCGVDRETIPWAILSPWPP
jgi:hypothetical protein